MWVVTIDKFIGNRLAALYNFMRQRRKPRNINGNTNRSRKINGDTNTNRNIKRNTSTNRKGIILQIKIQIGSPLQLHDRDDDDARLLQPPCLLVRHGGDDVTL